MIKTNLEKMVVDSEPKRSTSDRIVSSIGFFSPGYMVYSFWRMKSSNEKRRRMIRLLPEADHNDEDLYEKSMDELELMNKSPKIKNLVLCRYILTDLGTSVAMYSPAILAYESGSPDLSDPTYMVSYAISGFLALTGLFTRYIFHSTTEKIISINECRIKQMSLSIQRVASKIDLV